MEAPGEKLAIRIWETVTEKGIGALLEPWHKRRIGEAEIDLQRRRRLALAQTEQEIRAIESGTKCLEGGRLVDVSLEGESPPAPTLAERLQHNVLADQMRQEVNVARAVLQAEGAALEEGELADGQPPPDREVDDDWLYRWRDSASTVSNEKLQDLWGRALAGEVKSPGTFSLRTLEFLKNLSQQEAQLIEKLAPFVIDGNSVHRDWSEDRHTSLESYGISGSDLMMLDNLGVIDDSPLPVERTISIPLQGRVLLLHNRLLIVKPGTEHKEAELVLSVYRLTTVGGQVLRLGSFGAHEGYLRSVGEAIKKLGFKVQPGASPVDWAGQSGVLRREGVVKSAQCSRGRLKRTKAPRQRPLGPHIYRV